MRKKGAIKDLILIKLVRFSTSRGVLDITIFI